jgi:hypothetical protein
MTKINFVVGLTDVEDYDGFVYDIVTPVTDNIKLVNYNIKKADTSIEKDSIIWEMDLTIDATKNVIKVWEHIIRRPHLTMVNIQSIESVMGPTYDNYILNINFMNLVPILSDYMSNLTDADYEKITPSTNFGDMYLDTYALYMESNIEWRTTLEYAFAHNTLDKISKYVPVNVVPGFSFNFELKRNPVSSSISSRSSDFTEWLNKNKDILTKNGYVIDEPYCNVGRLCVGKLIGDPWEAYQKLQKYSRICRTSMVVVEE